jgi:hypothetical protein
MTQELNQLLTRWVQPSSLPVHSYVLRVYWTPGEEWSQAHEHYCVETVDGAESRWFGSWEALGAYLQSEFRLARS